jgi:uncharacterized Zn finger protein
MTVRGDATKPAHAPVFGRTWWGRAWVDALEQRGQLDPTRLPRGATYARDGSVDQPGFAPGEVSAQVTGRRAQPYHVRVRVRQFTPHEWDRVLEAICARLSHAAALLDGDLPPDVADDVAATGLSLLPGPGEVGPRCTCPDEADPCKHSAAVCHLIADALDADPSWCSCSGGGHGMRSSPAYGRGVAAKQWPARPPSTRQRSAAVPTTAWTRG